MDVERNHYRVLLVAPDASVDEIERSFRQLARRLHPDLNGGDGAAEERMKELNVARTTLTDASARAAYDERLRRAQPAKPTPAPARAKAPVPPRPPTPAKPLVSWMRKRDAPPPPTSRPEIDPLISVSRMIWISLAALLGLAVVVGLIWLRQALDS